MKTKDEQIKEFNEKQARKLEDKKEQDKKTVILPDKTGDTPSVENDKSTEELIADKAAETEQDRKDKQQQLKEDEEKQKETVNQLTNTVTELTNRVNGTINPAKNWLASQPTPGGLTAMVLFVIFMMLVIIPVNDKGQTRFYLLLNTLLGRTHMLYRENTSPGQGSNIINASSTIQGTPLPNPTPTPPTNGNPVTTLVSPSPVDWSKLNIFNV